MGGWLIILLFGVAGCSSVVDNLPSPLGLPAGTPERPAKPPAFPPLYDPAPRESKPLTQEEQKKLEAELAAARERQNARAKGAAKASDDAN
jgi:hypothetical protein